MTDIKLFSLHFLIKLHNIEYPNYRRKRIILLVGK